MLQLIESYDVRDDERLRKYLHVTLGRRTYFRMIQRDCARRVIFGKLEFSFLFYPDRWSGRRGLTE